MDEEAEVLLINCEEIFVVKVRVGILIQIIVSFVSDVIVLEKF